MPNKTIVAIAVGIVLAVLLVMLSNYKQQEGNSVTTAPRIEISNTTTPYMPNVTTPYTPTGNASTHLQQPREENRSKTPTTSATQSSAGIEVRYRASGYAIVGGVNMTLYGTAFIGIRGRDGYGIYNMTAEYNSHRYSLFDSEAIYNGTYLKLTCFADSCTEYRDNASVLPMDPILHRPLRNQSDFLAIVRELDTCRYGGREGRLFEIEIDAVGRAARALYGARAVREHDIVCMSDIVLYQESRVLDPFSGMELVTRIELEGTGPYRGEAFRIFKLSEER